MNCDCIKDIESAMANFMKPKAGDHASAKIMNTVFYLDGSKVGGGPLKSTLQIPFRIKGDKKGFTGEKGREMGCNVSYCPFCGRTAGRYSIGQDIGIETAMPSTEEAAPA